MKRLLYLSVVLIVISLGGCGGGSGVLPTGDMSGIQGIWDYVAILNGNISGPGGSIPINDTVNGYLIITANSVEDGDGFNYVWGYNGNTLTLQGAESETFWDVDCGNILISVQYEIEGNIPPGTTASAFTGNVSGSGISDNCTGTLSISGTYNGNLTKR